MNEVGTGLTLQEAQALAWPRNLYPLQQELMSWHHRLYHLPFRILFRLSSMGFLPKRFMECRDKPPLCVPCQFSAAYRCLWQTKGNKSGSICRPEQTNPRNGVLLDNIVSDQPILITQMSGFITSHSFWGCTNFVDNVSEYVYVHLTRYLPLSETLLEKQASEKTDGTSRANCQILSIRQCQVFRQWLHWCH